MGSLERGLEKYVCKIIDSEGKVRGTGFFIRPDGHIATCYHAVKACKGNVKVGIFGVSEPIICEIVRENELCDIAVLKINRENCPVLLLSPDCKPGDQIFSHGFSIQHPSTEFPQGFPIKSIMSGNTTIKSGLEMLVLENTEVDYGMSGAPAVDGRTDNVIGILTLKYQEGKKALVIPADRLFEMWPELKNYHEPIQYEHRLLVDKRDIIRYLKSLQNNLDQMKKARSEFFIDKLSQNIAVKRWYRRSRTYKDEPIPIPQILENKESPIAIIGAGGTGKTFTLWKWCIDTCKKLDILLNDGKIPVYIPLADLGRYEPGTLKQHIKKIKKGGEAIDTSFDDLESNGRLFFIFDGFNEIGLRFKKTPEKILRNYFENTKTDLCEYWKKLQGNGCVVVVTSRDTTPYLEEDIRSFFGSQFFIVYMVEPLSNSNIIEISEDRLNKESQRFIASLEYINGYDCVRDA
jgi:hypothetical protein